MLTTVMDAVRQGLVKAYLEILEPVVAEPDRVIPVCFNPTEYQIQKTNNYEELKHNKLPSPPIQYNGGASEKLTVDLLVDTSDTLENVRERYVQKIRNLMDINTEFHGPPVVRFVWGDRQHFKGVLDSLTVTYQLFTPEGIPLRAKLGVSIKEYRPASEQLNESKTASPDFEKTYVVRRGDTLSSISAAVYRDPKYWRDIARANDIRDPRGVAPGRVLTLPRLR